MNQVICRGACRFTSQHLFVSVVAIWFLLLGIAPSHPAPSPPFIAGAEAVVAVAANCLNLNDDKQRTPPSERGDVRACWFCCTRAVIDVRPPCAPRTRRIAIATPELMAATEGFRADRRPAAIGWLSAWSSRAPPSFS